jgi:hypothetical protein
MTHYSREQLYDLVWSEPIKGLAKRFELTDNGFRKRILHLNIPLPDRSYWAKANASKPKVKIKLPPRGPAQPHSIDLGPNSGWGWNPGPEEILSQRPPLEPVFDEPLEALEERVRRKLGTVERIKTVTPAHGPIYRYVLADQKQAEVHRASNFNYHWNKPLFQSDFENRRFKFLARLFAGLLKFGGRLNLSGETARECSISVGLANVAFALDHPSAKPDRLGKWPTREGWADLLRLTIGTASGEASSMWEDNEHEGLESQLTNIVVSLVVEAERVYRAAEFAHHKRALTRRVEADEALVRRREDQRRAEQEAIAKAAKQAESELLSKAHAYRDAEAIRQLVSALQSRLKDQPAMDEPLDQWATWALEIADQKDPTVQVRLEEGRLKL